MPLALLARSISIQQVCIFIHSRGRTHLKLFLFLHWRHGTVGQAEMMIEGESFRFENMQTETFWARTNGALEMRVNAVRWAHAHVWAYVCDAATIVDTSVTLKAHPSTVSLPVVDLIIHAPTWFARIVLFCASFHLKE